MKAYIRHYQRKDNNGDPIYYDGTDTLNIYKTTVPPFGFNSEYLDATCDILNLSKINFIYSLGEGDQRQKSETSGALEIVGASAKFIKDWIHSRPYASQNVIEIKFYDDKCNQVIDEMIIKAQKIRFCTPSNECKIVVTAEANNEKYNCLSKYKITDNWNGFLDGDYRSYSYVVEKHPKIMTRILYMLGSLIFIIGLSLGVILAPINGLIALVNTIAGTNIPTIPGLTPNELAEAMRRMLGFGRAHSAASVADYITNICDRCDIPIDTANNLFFQPTLDLADGTSIVNPYTNLDILFARSEKGRRDDDPNKRKLIPNNTSLLTLPELLDDLAQWANAKWYISPMYGLRFIPAYTSADPIIYDYSQQKTCIEVNGVTVEKVCVEYAQDNPKLGQALEFSADPIELAGNDALPRYNSRLVLDANEDNPNLKGTDETKINFGAARFRNDGILKEFVRDVISDPLTLLGTTIFTIWIILILFNAASNLIGAGAPIATVVIAVAAAILLNVAVYAAGLIWGIEAYENVLQMSQDTADLPKLLLWDGNNADQAQVVIEPNYPAPNVKNNSDTYTTVHQNEDPIILHNYPVFLDCRFLGSAYSNLHSWEDRRIVSLVENVIEIEMYACCEHKKLLGLYQGQERATNKRIGHATEWTYQGDALDRKETEITTIEVNYTTSKVKIVAVGR